MTHVALKLNLSKRQQSRGRARIARQYNQLAVRRPRGGPFEVVRCLRGFVVLVSAEESYVEIVPWISEVVVVAAKERDLLFNRKDQSNVGVLLEAVEPVFAAAV